MVEDEEEEKLYFIDLYEFKVRVERKNSIKSRKIFRRRKILRQN